MAKKNKESIDDLMEGTEYVDNKKRKHNIKKNKESLDDLLEGTEYVDNKKSNKKLRQPTLSERLALKTYQDISPKKVQAYMQKRGIDPNFDEGFTWHDFSLDILGDLVTGSASAATGSVGFFAGGGPLSPLTSVPTALAAGTAGGTGARMSLAALAKLFGSELAPDDMEKAAKRMAKEEALASAAFGAGPVKGAAQVVGRGLLKGAGKGVGYLARKTPEFIKKGLKDTIEPTLEVLMGIEKGIGNYVDRLAKRWKKLPKAERRKKLKSALNRSHDPSGGPEGTKNFARSVFGKPDDINTNSAINFYNHAQASVAANNKRLKKAIHRFDDYDTDMLGGDPTKQISINKLELGDDGMRNIDISGGNAGNYGRRIKKLLEGDVKKQRNAYREYHWNKLEPQFEKEIRAAKIMDKQATANLSEFTPMGLRRNIEKNKNEALVIDKYKQLLGNVIEESESKINYKTVPLNADKVHKVYTMIQRDATSVPGVGTNTNPFIGLAARIRNNLIENSKNPNQMGSAMDNYATSTRLKKSLDGMNNGKPWTITKNPGTNPKKTLDPTTGLAEKLKQAVYNKPKGDPGAAAVVDTLQEAERFYGNPNKSGLTPKVRRGFTPKKTSQDIHFL